MLVWVTSGLVRWALSRRPPPRQRVDSIARLLEKALIKIQKFNGNGHARLGGGGWKEAMNLRYGFAGAPRYVDEGVICNE